MNLNKKEQQKIDNILLDLKKAEKYLSREDIIIGRKGSQTAMPEHKFFNANNEQITEFQKFIGSDLQYLRNAIEKLEYLLAPEPVLTEEEF
jgi:hypothetical protein